MSDRITRARAWIGTPYQHQAALKDVGCDCLGLLLGLWREEGRAAPLIPAYSRDWNEASGREALWHALTARFELAQGLWNPGQILLFRMSDGAVAKHLGLLSQAGRAPRFIHAMSGHGVVECHLTRPWRRRVVARFSWPEEEI